MHYNDLEECKDGLEAYGMAFKEMRIAKSLAEGVQWKEIVKGISRKKPKIKGHP